jgi:hypothetical protein
MRNRPVRISQKDQSVMQDYNKKVMPDSKVEHHHDLKAWS